MKNRIHYILALATVVIVTLFGVLTVLYRNILHTQLAAKEAGVVELAAHFIQDDLERLSPDILFLAADSEVQELLQSTSAPRSTIDIDPVVHLLRAFSRNNPNYSRSMLFDQEGRSLFSISRLSGQYVGIKDYSFQNLREKKAFDTAIGFDRGMIFVSSIDLSEENGKIVEPLDPSILVSTPIFEDDANIPSGVLILEFSTRSIFEKLEDLESDGSREILILNSSGFFIKGESLDQEWGFKYQNNAGPNAAEITPQLWSAINDTNSGEVIYADSMWSFTTICDASMCNETNERNEVPIVRLVFEGADFPWHLVSQVSDVSFSIRQMKFSQFGWLFPVALFLAIVLLVGVYLTWSLFRTTDYLKQARDKGKELASIMDTFVRFNPSIKFLKSVTGEFIYANEAFTTFYNIKIGEVAGKTELELLGSSPDEQRVEREHIVFSTKRDLSVLEKWEDANGKGHFFVVSRFPVLDSKGNVKGIGTVAIDVTDREMAQRQVEESKQKFVTIFQASPNGVLIVSETGQINMANKAAGRIFKADENGLVGRNIESLLPVILQENHFQLRDDQVRNTASGDEIVHVEVQVQLVDDSLIDVELSLQPIRFDDQSWTLAVIKDITEKKKMDAHLIRAQKMESVGRLVGTVAHDFNNMLSVIIGSLDLVVRSLKKGEGVQTKKRVETALKAAISGASITQKLLGISRKKDLHAEPLNVIETVYGILPLIGQTSLSRIDVAVNIDNEALTVFVDRAELENVLLNLCINARDSMPNGGTISIDASSEYLDQSTLDLMEESIEPGKYVKISVSDTGVGMPASLITKIFEPYFSTKETGKGTGLGLFQVYKFVTQSNGLIKVYSEEGIGTAFHLFLPTGTITKSLSKKLSAIPQNIARGNEHILVVDDNKDFADIACEQLRGLGYLVDCVYSGEQALELLTKKTVQLVVADIFMPGGMNGVELGLEVRNRYPGIKMVFATGSIKLAMGAEGLKDFDAPLLSKPFGLLKLANTIRGELDKSMDVK